MPTHAPPHDVAMVVLHCSGCHSDLRPTHNDWESSYHRSVARHEDVVRVRANSVVDAGCRETFPIELWCYSQFLKKYAAHVCLIGETGACRHSLQ